MKKLLIIVSCVMCALSFIGGWYAHGVRDPEIRILTKTETVREWKYKAQDLDALPLDRQWTIYRECYYSPIEIDGVITQNAILHVRAATSCQTATRDFTIECGQAGNWKTYAIIGGAGLLTGGAVVLLLR